MFRLYFLSQAFGATHWVLLTSGHVLHPMLVRVAPTGLNIAKRDMKGRIVAFAPKATPNQEAVSLL